MKEERNTWINKPGLFSRTKLLYRKVDSALTYSELIHYSGSFLIMGAEPLYYLQSRADKIRTDVSWRP